MIWMMILTRGVIIPGLERFSKIFSPSKSLKTLSLTQKDLCLKKS